MRLFSRMAGVMLNDTINLRNWKGTVLILGIAIIFSGCGHTSKFGRKLDDNSVKQIKIGMTTKSEVIQLIGNPSKRDVEGNKERWVYVYHESSGSANAATFIPVVGAFVGGGKGIALTQNLAIEFKGDVVTQCRYTKSTDSVSVSNMGGRTADPGNSVTTDCEKAE